MTQWHLYPECPWQGDHAHGKNRAHTCLESPQVSSCHSEFVAPLSVAHVRGEAVIQSISWVTQESETVRTLQQQGMASKVFLMK